MKNVLLVVAGLVLMAGSGAYAYLALMEPNLAPAKDIKLEITPQRLERGKFVFEVLADCVGCHSERDWTKFAGPVKEGRLGAGFQFPAALGFPGDVVAPNITPDRETGIGSWTDGEKIRAIREGISKDGHALFPFMPYRSFRQMSDEDVYAVVAYMNTLPPIRNQLPRTKLSFPVNYLIKAVPAPVTAPISSPSKSDPVRYGEYLVTMASCMECHSQTEKGEIVKGTEFGGGHLFQFGPVSVVSANITPEMITGIGSWDEEQFISKFQGYSQLTRDNAPMASQANFTIMPWLHLSKLPEDDLRAIYTFLRTVKPVRNAVEPHKPLIPQS